MQRIIDLLNKCRTRPVHQVYVPLIRDEENSDEKKETKHVSIKIDDPITEFKENQAVLKHCIALFNKQKRKARAWYFAPSFISGISAPILGGVLIYYNNKIISNYSTTYHAFSDTRTNCTYVDYNYGDIRKNFSDILCPDIHYPYVMRGYHIYYNQYCRFRDFRDLDIFSCCYDDNLYLKNTTGLEVCTQLLFQFCHAHYEKHSDNFIAFNVLGWIAVAAAIIYFVGKSIYYKYRESSIIDNSYFKVSDDTHDIDMLYHVAQRYRIYQGEREDFVSELRSHPTRLHSAYQEVLRKLENSHIKFLTRFTFLQGLSRSERNLAPMRILAEAKNNFISIFEFADASIDKDFSARKAFLSATHDKNEGVSAHQFFKSIKEEKDSDGNEIYEKDEMMDTIFRFAGI